MSINTDYLATSDADTLIKGDDWDFWFTIVDENNVAIDVSNWEIWFTQKAEADDADPGIFQYKQVITATESDPVNGLIKFRVPNLSTINSSTEKVLYDIQLVNTTVTPSIVKTLKYGKMKAVGHRTVSIA